MLWIFPKHRAFVGCNEPYAEKKVESATEMAKERPSVSPPAPESTPARPKIPLPRSEAV